MLCQFTFKNYKSYRDETILDMQAVSSQGFEHSLLPDGNKQEMLPVAAIYGPNAGGKSNVLDALKCLHSLVVSPILLFRGQTTARTVNCVPFLFDEKTPDEPTEFEIFFIPDAEFEYRYQISIQKGKIVEENLYRRQLAPNSRLSTLFERSDGDIKLGASIRKQSINTEVNEQMPYLSILRPRGTFYAFPGIAKTGMEDGTFCNFLLEKAHLLVAPGHVFGRAGEKHFRIACTVSDAKLAEAMDRLEALGKYFA